MARVDKPKLTESETQELERLKAVTGLSVLSKEHLESLIDARTLPKEAREDLAKRLEEATVRDGNNRLLKAFYEGVMTEQEWLDWRAKGLTVLDFSTILGALEAGRELQKKGENLMVVTEKGSNIWNHRTELGKRFGLHIIDLGRANKMMEAELKRMGGLKDETR
jgi:hypothetical protein